MSDPQRPPETDAELVAYMGDVVRRTAALCDASRRRVSRRRQRQLRRAADRRRAEIWRGKLSA